MNNDLKSIIQQVKVKLSEEPAGIIIGKLDDGRIKVEINNNSGSTE